MAVNELEMKNYFSKREFTSFLETFNNFNNVLADFDERQFEGLELNCYRPLYYLWCSTVKNANEFARQPNKNEVSYYSFDKALEIYISYLKEYMHFYGLDYLGHDLKDKNIIIDYMFGEDKVYQSFVNGVFPDWIFKDTRTIEGTRKKLKEYCLNAITEQEKRLKRLMDYFSGKVSAYSLKSELESKINEARKLYDSFKYASWGDINHQREEIVKKVDNVFSKYMTGPNSYIEQIKAISNDKSYYENVKLYFKFEKKLNTLVTFLDYAYQTKKYRKGSSNYDYNKDGYYFMCLRFDSFLYDSNKLY